MYILNAEGTTFSYNLVDKIINYSFTIKDDAKQILYLGEDKVLTLFEQLIVISEKGNIKTEQKLNFKSSCIAFDFLNGNFLIGEALVR